MRRFYSWFHQVYWMQQWTSKNPWKTAQALSSSAGEGEWTLHQGTQHPAKIIADSLCPKGSRLPHLYGLPKTHKPELSMRPILLATNTYNYPLAKWLEEKLKPLSTNAYTISDIFQFSEDIRNIPVDADHILVSLPRELEFYYGNSQAGYYFLCCHEHY